MWRFRYVPTWLWRILISIDQLGNTLLGIVSRDFGEPDETISSTLGRRAQGGRLTLPEKGLVWVLDQIDSRHVFEAIERPDHAMLHAPRRLSREPISVDPA